MLCWWQVRCVSRGLRDTVARMPSSLTVRLRVCLPTEGHVGAASAPWCAALSLSLRSSPPRSALVRDPRAPAAAAERHAAMTQGVRGEHVRADMPPGGRQPAARAVRVRDAHVQPAVAVRRDHEDSRACGPGGSEGAGYV